MDDDYRRTARTFSLNAIFGAATFNPKLAKERASATPLRWCGRLDCTCACERAAPLLDPLCTDTTCARLRSRVPPT